MERWFTIEEVLADSDQLWVRLTEGADDSDLAAEVADSVLRLAIQGKVEIGEQDGRMVIRESTRVYHPDFGIWTIALLMRRSEPLHLRVPSSRAPDSTRVMGYLPSHLSFPKLPGTLPGTAGGPADRPWATVSSAQSRLVLGAQLYSS